MHSGERLLVLHVTAVLAKYLCLNVCVCDCVCSTSVRWLG